MSSQNQNDIDSLRSALFDTLRSLQDKENPMDLERAKAINDTAQTIINASKVEVDFLKANGSVDTGFFKSPSRLGLPPPPDTSERLPKPQDDENDDLNNVAVRPDTTGISSTGGRVTIDHRNGQRIVTHKAE